MIRHIDAFAILAYRLCTESITGDFMSTELATHTTTYTQEQVDLIKRTICSGATNDELSLFIQQCKRTGLDPFSRQIHAVKRWNGREKREVMSIQTGIDGYRLIADRTGKYAGSDDPVYDVENAVHPGKATVTVWKIIDGARVAFSRSARWAEFVQLDKDGNPTRFWQKMPYLMLGKVAEALALRAAFPQELSGIYTADEMGQADSEPVKHQTNGVHKEPKPAALPPKTEPVKPTLATMIEKWTAHDFKGDGAMFGKWLAACIARLPEVATIPDDTKDLAEYVRESAGIGDLQEWHDMTGEQLLLAKNAVCEWLGQLQPKG